MNARPEDQTANLNRCLFFITPLISYATPPFYSEFRLHCRKYVYVYAYPRDAHVSSGISVHLRIHIDSLRYEFVTASRLIAVPLHLPRLPLSPADVSSFLRVYHEPILLSTTIQGCIESHRCICTRIVYLLDQFTLKVPSDPVASHAHRHDRSAGKLLLSRESQDNFVLDSKERITKQFLESG